MCFSERVFDNLFCFGVVISKEFFQLHDGNNRSSGFRAPAQKIKFDIYSKAQKHYFLKDLVGSFYMHCKVLITVMSCTLL